MPCPAAFSGPWSAVPRPGDNGGPRKKIHVLMVLLKIELYWPESNLGRASLGARPQNGGSLTVLIRARLRISQVEGEDCFSLCSYAQSRT